MRVGTAVNFPIEQLREELDAAEARFKDGDLMAGLYGAKIAIEHDAPIPRAIGRWLHSALAQYLYAGPGYAHRQGLDRPRKTIDEALGLKQPGNANPMRRALQARRNGAALADMLRLQMIGGATIPEAATLVAFGWAGLSSATLEHRYRRSGYGKQAREGARLVRWSASDLEKVLSQYPDRPPELAKIKARLRQRVR